MKKQEQDYLEVEFIDRYGLIHTLDAITDICSLKADHVRSNWQDSSLADQ